MSKRLYSYKRVRYWYPYDIEDICSLFSDCGLHPQTVRKWINNGLSTIDKGKPALIRGYDLITYLREQNTKGKCKTEFNQLFCMKCQDARHLLQRKITVEQKAAVLRVKGHCRECKTEMWQNYKITDLSQLRKTFRMVDVLELYDNAASSGKTHIAASIENTANESGQLRLL